MDDYEEDEEEQSACCMKRVVVELKTFLHTCYAPLFLPSLPPSLILYYHTIHTHRVNLAPSELNPLKEILNLLAIGSTNFQKKEKIQKKRSDRNVIIQEKKTDKKEKKRVIKRSPKQNKERKEEWKVMKYLFSTRRKRLKDHFSKQRTEEGRETDRIV